MVNSCYLCDRKASKADNISLHRFPKNLDVRRKWLSACGLSVNDDIKRTSLCSRHFKAEDICLSNIFGTVKSSIKRSAVPILYLKNPLSVNIETSNKFPPNTPLSKLNKRDGVANQSLSHFLDNNIVGDNNSITYMNDHFIGGKKSEEHLSPSYIPTIFPSIYKDQKVNEVSTILNRYNHLKNRRIKNKPQVDGFVEIMIENPPVVQLKVDQECQVGFHLISDVNSQTFTCNRYINKEICHAEIQTEILNTVKIEL